MSQKGFTLIELAIVVVLIGVIMAGVIKGTAFIQLAEAKKVITDATSMIDAQNRFREREKRYAGDTDNNGLIDFTTLGAVTFDGAATAGNDVDSSFNELKNVGLFSSDTANSLIAETQETGTMHFAGATVTGANSNVTVLNILAIRNVTCQSAFQLEMNIDKQAPDAANCAGTGRIRMITAAGTLASSGEWTSNNTACVVEGVVSDTARTSVAFLF